jgi:CRP-like cAMP-binding protein
MEDLDFSQPAPAAPKPAAVKPPPPPGSGVNPLYNPALALKFFQIAGEAESFPAGTTIFAEQDKPGGLFAKGARVYLLLEGEVALTLKGKPLNLVMPGELLGELSIITGAPRSATATARKNCRVLSLDEKRFVSALQQLPEFSFMLVSIMAQRLVHGVDRLLASRKGPMPPREGGTGLDGTQLIELKRAMGDPTPTPMQAGDAIVKKGAVGVSMFVVTAGRVEISVNDRRVETVGRGETFGETAVLGPNVRAATATAVSDGAFLAISREAFLRVVRANPALGIALLRSISERVQHMDAFLGS